MGTKRDLEAIEARRIAGARLLKKKVAQAEVARELGVSRQAVSVWARQLAEVNGAVGKLKARPSGRPKSEKCPVTRSWAKRGQTPVIQQSFSWSQMSAMAGLSWWRV